MNKISALFWIRGIQSFVFSVLVLWSLFGKPAAALEKKALMAALVVALFRVDSLAELVFVIQRTNDRRVRASAIGKCLFQFLPMALVAGFVLLPSRFNAWLLGAVLVLALVVMIWQNMKTQALNLSAGAATYTGFKETLIGMTPVIVLLASILVGAGIGALGAWEDGALFGGVIGFLVGAVVAVLVGGLTGRVGS